MNPPTKVKVASVLKSLLAGTITRQEASDWATPYITGDVRVTDTHVWKALLLIGAADLCSTDRPFLYEDEDVQECLRDLEDQG